MVLYFMGLTVYTCELFGPALITYIFSVVAFLILKSWLSAEFVQRGLIVLQK